MENDHPSKITTRLSDKRNVLIAAGAVVLFVIVLIFLIITFGMYAGDPRGEAPGPGP